MLKDSAMLHFVQNFKPDAAYGHEVKHRAQNGSCAKISLGKGSTVIAIKGSYDIIVGGNYMVPHFFHRTFRRMVVGQTCFRMHSNSGVAILK